MLRRQVLRAGLAAGVAAPALAQAEWPQRPVRLILPFAAGGGTDALSRVLAQRLAEATGQPFVIDNRGGAGGDLAILAGIAAPPDGHTLVMGSDASHVRGPLLRADMPYDPDAMLRPVARLVETWSCIAIPAAGPAFSLAEYAAMARAAGQPVSYGTAGPGTLSHAIAALYALQGGFAAEHIPYRGASLAIQDLMAGRLGFQAPAVGGLIPLLASRAVRVLAVTGPQSQPALPAPTMRQAGFPDLDIATWYGFFAPAGTPQAVLARAGALLGAAMQAPGVAEKLETLGLLPAFAAGTAFSDAIAAQRAHWRGLVARTGLRLT